jgi:hypothetical protein
MPVNFLGQGCLGSVLRVRCWHFRAILNPKLGEYLFFALPPPI